MDISSIRFAGRVVLVGALSLALAGVLAVAGTLLFAGRPNFDVAHPDYHALARQFERLSNELSDREPGEGDRVELSGLNRGDWRRACILGGYSNPLATADRLGAAVSPRDRERLLKAGTTGLRLAPVEEFEMVVSSWTAQARLTSFILSMGSDLTASISRGALRGQRQI